MCFATHEDLKRAIDKYQGLCHHFLHQNYVFFKGKDINGRRIKLIDDSDNTGGGGGRRR